MVILVRCGNHKSVTIQKQNYQNRHLELNNIKKKYQNSCIESCQRFHDCIHRRMVILVRCGHHSATTCLTTAPLICSHFFPFSGSFKIPSCKCEKKKIKIHKHKYIQVVTDRIWSATYCKHTARLFQTECLTKDV